ncbi:MAG: aspartyl protease family protein [Desulfobacterales bacterium]|nr:aspartyl protease family protein [Desulfobacterales bacterium]
MICPKCGFSQPDDAYCVLCGVNIEKYVRGKRKRRYKACLLVALVGIAALSVAKYVKSVRHAKTHQTVSKPGYSENKAQAKGNARIAAKDHRPVSGTKAYSPKKTGNRLQSKSLKEPLSTKSPEDKPPGRNASENKSRLDQQKTESRHEAPPGTLTAREWFEKGTALDDDSDTEIQCYQKAIEIDPKFSPAHYRLGAIYYRQANYELADKEFSQFLKYASQADREAYDIYVYYSLDDVERVSAKVEEQSPAEKGQEETHSEAKKESVGTAGEETGQETGEEVMTIVRFSPAEGHIIVPVVLNGFLKAKVLVDTGAGITILSKELSQGLRLEAEPDSSITLKTMTTDIQAQLARLDSIQVGNLSRIDFPVAILDLPLGERTKFDGVLGMDFMNHYKIHIDNENRTIVFTPKAGRVDHK